MPFVAEEDQPPAEEVIEQTLRSLYEVVWSFWP
jgi:hypothetical protein